MIFQIFQQLFLKKIQVLLAISSYVYDLLHFNEMKIYEDFLNFFRCREKKIRQQGRCWRIRMDYVGTAEAGSLRSMAGIISS